MTNRPEQLLALLGIHPGETRPVTLLMGLYFFLSIAIVLTQTVAFALFISANGPQMLPYAYLITAVGAALAAYIYLRLGDRLSFPNLLRLNLLFLIGASLIYRWGLSLTGSMVSLVIFGLPLWFQLITNLGNLAFWALTGSLFTVRQGKRLFGLVSTGSWVATIVGGFVAAPLIRWVGMSNLLLVSAVSLLCALLVLQVILRTCLTPRPSPPPSQLPASTPSKVPPSLFRSPYVWLIFAFLFVWWLGFNIIHSIFSDRAAQQYANVDQLGAFLGDIAGLSGVLALIMTGLFTAPVVQRYGLWGGLLVMPITVTVVIAILAVSGTWGASASMLFVLATLAKLLNVGLGFGLDQPAHSILYKPLPGYQIGRVPIIAEGIVQPLAVGSAGLILLAFGAAQVIGMSYLFVVIGLVWVAIIIWLIRVYRTALSDALAKRQLGEVPHALLDQSSIALLTRYLRDPYPGAVTYALQSLEQLDQRLAPDTLKALIVHPAAEVRREAFAYIERHASIELTDAVKAQLALEPLGTVREAALRALAATAPAGIDDLVKALARPTAADQRGALVGMLRHCGIDGVMLAGQLFNQLLTSSQTEDRILAGQVLGEVGLPHFYQPVLSLLRDEAAAVRRTALHAAGNIKHPSLWPLVINACDAPETRRSAMLALAAGGDAAWPWIERALTVGNVSWATRSALIQASGRSQASGRGQVLDVLEQQLAHPHAETRTHALVALSQCGYRAASAAQQHTVQLQLQQELGHAASALSKWVNIRSEWPTPSPAVALLVAALAAEVQHSRNRMLYLLSFLYEARSILKARQTLLAMDHGAVNSAQLAYAIELIDTQLPPDRKAMILALLELLSPEQRLARLSKAFPQTSQPADQTVAFLIDARSGDFTDWTRACALYLAGHISIVTCGPAVAQAQDDPTPLVRKMAQWAWAHLDPARHDLHLSAAQPSNGVGIQGIEVNHEMLSTIEKVIILKTVSVFAQTPEPVLAEVAELLEELDLDANTVIFHKDAPGDSLYLIVRGRVQVQDGDQILRHMGDREVFGEMALLDNEPRSASVITVVPTQLLRLGQVAFYELLAERPEIATGIIRVLMGYIRNLNRALAEAGAHDKPNVA